MSWQSYVDVNLLGSPNVEKASIFGHDGSLWATSAGFQISASEVKKVIDAFVNPSDAQANGLYLEGKKYVLLRADGTVIYARS
ncbi:profilin, required for normal timing of actin polymerization in response to thermal stress, partial [Lunasporangiospora selenospora]